MKKRQIFALLITLTFLVLIFHRMDWIKLIYTFRMFDLENLWIIIPIYIVTFYLRGIRWKALLLGKKKYTAYNLGTVFAVGSMLNIFLPARAGDVYRAYYLGMTKQEKKMKVFGSIVLERTFDGICVFLILLLAVLLYSRQEWIMRLTLTIGSLFVGGLVTFYLIFKFNKVDFICAKLLVFISKFPEFIANSASTLIKNINVHLNSLIEGFEVLNSLKYSSQAFAMSVLIWLIESVVAFLIINSFHINLGFSAALFVISLISFSTMIPSTSVFLGPYQYAYILALGIYSVDKSTALAISTIHQSILMLILTTIGGIYFLKFNLSLKTKQNESSSNTDNLKIDKGD